MQQPALINRQDIINAISALALTVTSTPIAADKTSVDWCDGYLAGLLAVAVTLGAGEELKQIERHPLRISGG